MAAADSYIDYVQPEKSLEDIGLVFIVFIKQVSCKFPMNHTQRRYFNRRGGCYGFFS